MKRIISVLAVLVLLASTATPEPQLPAPASTNGKITIASSAVRLVPSPTTAPPVMCSSILIQAAAGNTGIIYVLNAPVNITMTFNTAGTTTVAQLGVGTATSPGGSFTFPSNGSTTTQSGGADMRLWGISGTSGDVAYASCDVRQ